MSEREIEREREREREYLESRNSNCHVSVFTVGSGWFLDILYSSQPSNI